MQTLIIYDAQGNIWMSMAVDEIPSGLEKYIFQIPEGASVSKVDVTDPEHPVPIYTEVESYDMDQMSSDITDLQIALAEVYELVAGGME